MISISFESHVRHFLTYLNSPTQDHCDHFYSHLEGDAACLTTLRQLLTSGHRRVGPKQAMLNPHLNENQIEQLVAYFEVLEVWSEQIASPGKILTS